MCTVSAEHLVLTPQPHASYKVLVATVTVSPGSGNRFSSSAAPSNLMQLTDRRTGCCGQQRKSMA